MKTLEKRKALSLSFVAVAILAAGMALGQKSGNSRSAERQGVLHARVIATGIPGAGAVSEVGDFLRGSPIHDNATLAAYAYNHLRIPSPALVVNPAGQNYVSLPIYVWATRPGGAAGSPTSSRL